jgi:glycyl-tRNA synthetase beta chain
METLLLEIGTEEIPAGYINPALEALAATLQKKMEEARIEHGTVKIFGTPRRLAVRIEKVATKQLPLKTELTGPPVKVGFDDSGKPTMAAKKFAEKAGVSVKQLNIKETKKGAYLCAVKKEKGQSTRTLLKELMPKAILATPFPKTMRWADQDISFARPIYSCLALLGSKIISFKLGNVSANRYTYGHYFMQPGKIKIDSADGYQQRLKGAQVIVDIDRRREAVEGEITKAAQKVGGHILKDDELVDIVNNLVEYPVAVAGGFDKAFLELPDEVLITAMREHQKYFAVVDKSEKLLPYFIAVNNTKAKDMKLVTTGHERVLRARLADAQFFYQGDLDVSNAKRVEQLKGVLFQAQLGTMYEKVMRVGKVAMFLVDTLEEKKDLKEHVRSAARLCKSDLVSQVVVEFPKLQGVMGGIYAEKAGEPAQVASAIEEHYRPTYSGGPLPETKTGAILSIADKIDSICGCFSIGLTPTGASDPYALRRQGIGIIQIMAANGFSFSLRRLIEKSIKLFGAKNRADIEAVSDQVYEFLKNRIASMLAEEGYSKDVIASIVSVTVDCIPDAWSRARALEKLKAEPDFEPLVITFKRVVNIMKKSASEKERGAKQVQKKYFKEECERILYGRYREIAQKVRDDLEKGAFEKALIDIAGLKKDVDSFFDGAMVMDADLKIRRNRLALLGKIAALFEQFADFSKLTTSSAS